MKLNRFQVLDENGKVIDPNFFPDLSDEQIVELFKQMLWSRVLDERSTKLNRQGRLGFLLQLLGKKLRRSRLNLRWKKTDFLLPAYRDVPQLVLHGLPLEKAFLWSRGHVFRK